MASSRIRAIHVFLVVLPVSGLLAELGAQDAGRAVSHSIEARVPTLLKVREQTQPTFRPGTVVTTSSRLEVRSNARHDVHVRLDATDANASAVYVRDVAGVFRRLESNSPVAVAVDVPAGVATVQVAWRAEGVSAGGASLAITYVLVESRGTDGTLVAAARTARVTVVSE